MISPSVLCEFARRIGGFDEVVNLYSNYMTFGMSFEDEHYYCYCAAGGKSALYEACPSPDTGDVQGYSQLDLTDSSQLYTIPGAARLR